ncbi:MAG TPA: hypothetical protein VFO27_15050 [Bryobacteraceae bacterium]|nr:hypothetical protein [Bryobacteraceae bacterium]
MRAQSDFVRRTRKRHFGRRTPSPGENLANTRNQIRILLRRVTGLLATDEDIDNNTSQFFVRVIHGHPTHQKFT